MSTSRIPQLPELPLSARKASTPRGSAKGLPSPPSPRTLHMGGSRILTNANGAPIVVSSSSKTRYILAQPPNVPLPPVSPRSNSARHNNNATSNSNVGVAAVETAAEGNAGALVVADPVATGALTTTGGPTAGALQSYAPAAPTHTTLTRTDLRSIGNLVTFNSKLRHAHRQHNAAGAIPSLAFAVRLRGPCDDRMGLQVAPIDPQESALDVVLRLTSPEELRIPALKDPKASLPLSSRLVGLLKGSASLPLHGDGGVGGATVGASSSSTTAGGVAADGGGTAKDHSHVRAMRDAKMRIEAAKRQESALNEAKGRCALAALYYNSHNMEGAIQSLSPAAELFESCGHAAGLAFAHCTLGVAYFRNGEYKMALLHFRKLEALCGAYGRAVAQINMGVCYAALEEPQFAQQAFTDAVASAAEPDAGEPVLEAIAVGNQGLAYMRLGQMRQAQAALEECLERCSTAGDHIGTAVVLLLLGQNSAACRDYSQAVFYYEHAMRVATQAGNCAPLLAMAKVSVGVCRGQAEAEGQLMARATTMGKGLSVADVVTTLALKD